MVYMKDQSDPEWLSKNHNLWFFSKNNSILWDLALLYQNIFSVISAWWNYVVHKNHWEDESNFLLFFLMAMNFFYQFKKISLKYTRFEMFFLIVLVNVPRIMVLSRLCSNLIFNKTSISVRGYSICMGKSMVKIRLLFCQIVQILFKKIAGY